MATLEELKQAQQKLNNKNKNKNSVNNANVGFYEGITRAGGQGLTFGFGDEIEAGVKSFAKGTSYDDEVKLARAKIALSAAKQRQHALEAKKLNIMLTGSGGGFGGGGLSGGAGLLKPDRPMAMSKKRQPRKVVYY